MTSEAAPARATTTETDPALVRRDYGALAGRILTAARPPLSSRIFGQQVTPDGTERYDLLLVYAPPSRRRRATGETSWGVSPRRVFPRKVFLNGGTHGDEPAGAEAVTRFLEEERYRSWPDVEFTVTPCLNPWGYVHNRREGPAGRDLNRSFRRAVKGTQEVGALKRALRGRVFDLFIDCHEDVDAPGLYVFAPAALGRAIVERVRHLGPVHPGTDVDGEIPLKDSVVELDGERLREGRRTFTAWPLPFYVGRYHRSVPSPTPPPPPAPPTTSDADAAIPDGGGPLDSENVDEPDIHQMATATVETPTSLPLQQRVTMHLAAIDAALQALAL